MAADSTTKRGAEPRILREIILEQLSRRIGKTTTELWADVRGDFGSCDDRRLYRNLEFLISVGCVQHEERFDDDAGYTRKIYFRVSDEVPPLVIKFQLPRSCSICGMKNTITQAHARGHRAAKRVAAAMASESPQSCRICGMANTSAQSHPDHAHAKEMAERRLRQGHVTPATKPLRAGRMKTLRSRKSVDRKADAAHVPVEPGLASAG